MILHFKYESIESMDHSPYVTNRIGYVVPEKNQDQQDDSHLESIKNPQ